MHQLQTATLRDCGERRLPRIFTRARAETNKLKDKQELIQGELKQAKRHSAGADWTVVREKPKISSSHKELHPELYSVMDDVDGMRASTTLTTASSRKQAHLWYRCVQPLLSHANLDHHNAPTSRLSGPPAIQ